MFDWWDYWTLAQELAGVDDDARMRSAVSRAYYAAYHRVRRWALANGFSPDLRRSAHTQLWAFMLERAAEQARLVGQWGKDLRDQRNCCDYEDDVLSLGQDLVQLALDRAEDIRDAILKL